MGNRFLLQVLVIAGLVGAMALGPLPLSVAAAQDDEFDDEFGDEYDEYEDAQDEYEDANPDDGGDDEADSSGPLSPEEKRAQAFRTHNTWFGPTGGLHVVDAGSGLPGSFRLQLGFEYFGTTDWLSPDDEHGYAGGTLSGSWTLTDYLEVFGSLTNHASWNSAGDRDTGGAMLLQVLGDSMAGAKLWHRPIPWIAVGGDLRMLFLNAIGGIGLDAVSVGLRGNVSADLRKLDKPSPVILRFNAEYLFDNSASLLEEHEQAVYDRLPDPMPKTDEDDHFAIRQERFGLGINRADMFTFSLGGELPLRADEGLYFHPLLEWQLGIPIMREEFDCLIVTTDSGKGGEDGCLDIQGLAAFPSALTIGLRVFPPVRGLGLLLAADIGLTGTEVFVRELAPNRPWALLFGLSYAYDTAPPPSAGEPVEVIREVVRTEAPPQKARVRGLVVETGMGDIVAGAIVNYPGTEFTPQATDAQGRFVSYGLDAGSVQIEVSHPDYESRVCIVEVPAVAGAPAPAAAPAPAPTQGDAAAGGDAKAEGVLTIGAAGVSGDANVSTDGAAGPALPTPAPTTPETAAGVSAAAGPVFVDLRCELTARPRFASVRGSVVDGSGAAVPGARVQLSGTGMDTFTTDAGGIFASAKLAPGSYQVSVDAEGFLLKQGSFAVAPRGEATPRLQLTAKPKRSLVRMSKREVKIRRQIQFKSGSAEILEKSNALLTEIADVLMRNAQVQLVEVQGHTDNRGGSRKNLTLSQQRAESVVRWLSSAGVAATRMEAKGYGDTKPLVPNLTPRNRARNRRVQFMIRKMEAQ